MEIIKIKNLDCAACAAELEEELKKIEGVNAVSVDFVAQRVNLDCAKDARERCIYAISHFEEVEIVADREKQKEDRHFKEIFSIVLSLLFFIPALVLSFFPEITEWISFSFYLVSFAAAGWQIVLAVGNNFIKFFRGKFSALLDENTLMLIAAIGAFCIGENMEGAAVVILYEIGELLQSIAVGSSRGAIRRLTELKSERAILLNGDEQREVDADTLVAGDFVLLRKGDKVPADCRLVSEFALIDGKSLTGEADYKEVKEGEELLSGTVNAGDAVKAQVVRPASQSAAQKILDLVENATAKKAAPEKFITKFSRWYTPIVVLLALIVAVVPPLFQEYNFALWVERALNFLVISCPCALVISVPLTYFSGVGSLARAGVLVKGAVYLDVLRKAKVAAFDKTGTLTEGNFTVSAVHGEERALLLAAAVERNSSHPLAQAFRSVRTPYTAEGLKEIAGKGLQATVEGKEVLVGSARFLRENGIAPNEETNGTLCVYVAEEGKLVGMIEIQDKIKKEANEALLALKGAGIEWTAVLTGDSKERAEAALSRLPIDEIHAGLLPEEKSGYAKKLKERGVFLYVGDGINDTPVLAESDVSVAMGALGSAAAVEQADLVLATDRLTALPKAMKGAKKTGKIVFENIVFSIAVKVVLLILSLFGFLPLWAAVLGDVGVMLLAVLNSMRMRRKIS